MHRVLAHCLCRSVEFLVVLGILQLAIVIEAWAQV
jgi:hypothetical protein